MTTDVLDEAAVERRLAGAPDAPFWRYLQRGEVRLPRCRGCGDWVWPARPGCPRCHTVGVDWVEVAAEGTVYSHSRTWYPFVAARADRLPYTVVVVSLPGAGGSRLIGVIDGPDDDVVIGAPVVGSIAPPAAHSYGLPTVVWRLAGAQR